MVTVLDCNSDYAFGSNPPFTDNEKRRLNLPQRTRLQLQY